MACLLIIVARDQPELWELWRGWFSGIEGVEVILDRRRGERQAPSSGSAITRP